MREKIRQILYRGQCIDSDDPMRLGRIRAVPKTENTTNTEQSNTYTEWSYDDPFVFLPLLPFFINTPPKPDEYVHLVYSDLDKKLNKDKFYIPGVYSSPTTSNRETYNSAVTNLEEGTRVKRFQDVKDKDICEGVYAEPDDIALYGRGTADIILKDDTVILRAGKNKKFNRKQLPEKNTKRSFLQLSKFNQKTTYGNPEKVFKFKFDDKNIKLMVEYTLTNPENTVDSLSGQILIYPLKDDKQNGVDARNMTVDKVIKNESRGLSQTTVNFSSMKISEVSQLIKDILNKLAEQKSITQLIDDTTTNIEILNPQVFSGEKWYPIYYRPLPLLYKKLNETGDVNTKVNITNLMSQVSINATQVNLGYGLIVDKDKNTEIPFNPEKQETIEKNIERIDKSVSIMGSDEIYFLSYDSQKPNTNGKINLEKTLYGITEDIVADEIEPKTSSLVRGEELLEFLDLIVRFLVAHVHPFPGVPPVPVASDGTNAADILKELLIASEKVLNRKIRIN